MHSKQLLIPCLAVLALCPVGTAAEDAVRQEADTASARVIETQANRFEYNSQETPAIARDAQGRTLAVWGSRRQENGTFGIFGRLLGPDGTPIGPEIHVNQHQPNNQESPAVAFGRQTAWTVWRSHGQDGDLGTIVARRFGPIDDRFSALGDEVVVNTTIEGDQTQPAIAAGDDRVFVAWTTAPDDRQLVAGRVFTREGHAVTNEFIIAGADANQAWVPVITAQPEGRFVVAWAERGPDGTPDGLRFRRYDRDGSPLGDIHHVGTSDRHDVEPSIASDAAGGFVIVWMSRGERQYDVRAQRYAADGDALGAEIVVAADGEGWKSGGAVAVAPDGRFVAAWNVEGEVDPLVNARKPETPCDVLARRFTADGRPEGECFRVNQHVEGRQELTIGTGARQIAWGPRDEIIVAWHGNTGRDGSGVGVTTLRSTEAVAAVTRTDGLAIDDSIAALADFYPEPAGIAPPEFDPFFVPDPPDPRFLNPGGDFGFIGFQSTGWNPPDPDLAVGPGHVVVAVNGGIRFFTKSGTLLFSQAIAGSGGFWGGQGAGGFVFDPVLVYDVLSDRYICATTEHLGSNRSYLLLAVSDDDDPNGTWHKYRWNLQSIGGFIDFPNLGVGPDAIYIATDFFDTPTGNQIHIINKADAMAGLPTSPTSVRMSNGFRSTGAVKTYDADAPAQYFATSHIASTSRIALDAIVDPLGSPQVTTIELPVPAYANPPDADQLGTSNKVSTVGRRIKNGVYRNGSLWLVHTTGEDSTARVRWYEFEMNGWPTSGNNPTLRQSGTQNLGPLVHNWFGDINVDDQGNMAIAFNQSSPSEYVSVQRTYRQAEDPLGTLRPPQLMQASTSSEFGSRWGDYAGLEEDPVAPGTFWSHHEYRTSSWRTWVGKFSIVEEALPTSFGVAIGQYLQGDLDDLYFDDSSRLGVQVRPAFSPILPVTRVETQGTASELNPSEFGFKLDAAAFANPPASRQVIRLFNYDTNSWEVVDERLATQSDQLVEVTFTSNTSRFINQQNGEIRARLDWFDVPNAISPNWSVWIDQAVWVVIP